MPEECQLLDRVDRIKQTIKVLKFWQDAASDDAIESDHWRRVKKELATLSTYIAESGSNVETLRPRVEGFENLLR